MSELCDLCGGRGWRKGPIQSFGWQRISSAAGSYVFESPKGHRKAFSCPHPLHSASCPACLERSLRAGEALPRTPGRGEGGSKLAAKRL